MDIKIDRKSSILFLGLISVIILALATVISSFVIKKDFFVTLKQECDPRTRVCFVEGEADEQESYTLFRYKAYDLGTCDGVGCVATPECSQKNGCTELVCSEETITTYAPDASCSDRSL